jgi:hypothetical protein
VLNWKEKLCHLLRVGESKMPFALQAEPLVAVCPVLIGITLIRGMSTAFGCRKNHFSFARRVPAASKPQAGSDSSRVAGKAACGILLRPPLEQQ